MLECLRKFLLSFSVAGMVGVVLLTAPAIAFSPDDPPDDPAPVGQCNTGCDASSTCRLQVSPFCGNIAGCPVTDNGCDGCSCKVFPDRCSCAL